MTKAERFKDLRQPVLVTSHLQWSDEITTKYWCFLTNQPNSFKAFELVFVNTFHGFQTIPKLVKLVVFRFIRCSVFIYTSLILAFVAGIFASPALAGKYL